MNPDQAAQQKAEQQELSALAWIDQPTPEGWWGSPTEIGRAHV